MVNVSEVLKAAGPEGISFASRPEAVVFQLLKADTEAAKACRTPYTHIVLKTKEMLPFWIAPDAVGGKTLLPGDATWSVDPTMPMNKISQFDQAL